MPYAEVTGLDMYHDVQGDGEPLVLVHAGMASVPDRWIPFFAPYLRVIAPEQMGGVVPPTSASGYSDGGIVGLDIAIHHPRRRDVQRDRSCPAVRRAGCRARGSPGRRGAELLM